MFQHLFYSEQNYKQVFEFHTIAKLIHQVATGDVTFNNNLIKFLTVGVAVNIKEMHN